MVHEWENGHKVVCMIKSRSKENKFIYFMNWLGVPLQAFNVGACRMDYEPRTLEEILENAGVIMPRPKGNPVITTKKASPKGLA